MSDADSEDGFRPRSAPQGVIPADLIGKKTSLTRRKKGRPAMVPTTLAEQNPAFALRTPKTPLTYLRKASKPSSSSRAEDAPSLPSKSLEAASISSTQDTPTRQTRSSKRSRPDSDCSSPFRTPRHLINVPTPKAQPNANLDRAYSDWMAHIHSTPDHRAVGDMAEDSDSEHDGTLADDETDDEYQPCRVPNVHVSKEPLRRMRKPLTSEDGYERKELRISHLLRFFAQTVRLLLNILAASLTTQDIELKLENHTVYDQVRFKWLDGPGFHPADIRARRVEMKIPHKLARKSPDLRVWRVRYRCNGFCSHRLKGDNDIRPPALATTDNINEQLAAFAGPAAERFRSRLANGKQPRSRSRPTTRYGRVQDTDKPGLSEESLDEAEFRRSNRVRTKQQQSGGGKRRRLVKKKVLGSASSDDDSVAGSGTDGNKTKSALRKRHRTTSPQLAKTTHLASSYEDDVFDPEDSDTEIDYEESFRDSPGKEGIGEAFLNEDGEENESSDSDDNDNPSQGNHGNRCDSFVVVRSPISRREIFSLHLQLEMTADQCRRGRCTVVMQRPEWHPPTPSGRLRCSRYLRRLLHEAALGFGMTAGRLSACTCLVNVYCPLTLQRVCAAHPQNRYACQMARSKMRTPDASPQRLQDRSHRCKQSRQSRQKPSHGH